MRVGLDSDLEELLSDDMKKEGTWLREMEHRAEKGSGGEGL